MTRLRKCVCVNSERLSLSTATVRFAQSEISGAFLCVLQLRSVRTRVWFNTDSINSACIIMYIRTYLHFISDDRLVATRNFFTTHSLLSDAVRWLSQTRNPRDSTYFDSNNIAANLLSSLAWSATHQRSGLCYYSLLFCALVESSKSPKTRVRN